MSFYPQTPPLTLKNLVNPTHVPTPHSPPLPLPTLSLPITCSPPNSLPLPLYPSTTRNQIPNQRNKEREFGFCGLIPLRKKKKNCEKFTPLDKEVQGR